MQDNSPIGILPDMPNGEYHATTAIGSSGLKLLLRNSPLHYWSAYIDPDREPSEPTMLMRIGTAWHAAIFEPDQFAADYAAEPDISKNSNLWKLFVEAQDDLDEWMLKYTEIPDGLGNTSKEGKALLAELDAMGQVGIEAGIRAQVIELAEPRIGKVLLPAETLDDVRAMAASARRHPIASVVLDKKLKGAGEVSLFWDDPTTGVRCKIRPDYMVPPCELFPNGLVIDGKSNDDSSPDGFARGAFNGDFHLQAAYYADGFQQIFKTAEPPPFLWLAQERGKPYATAMYSCSPDLMAYGRKLYRAALAKYANCLRTDTWPGYQAQVHDIALPAWAQKQISEAA